MYRRLRRHGASGGLDLDSLMDILSCLVGVMLFLVIYTVLQLGSVAYEADVVVSPEVREGDRQALVLAEDGTVRLLNPSPALARLVSGFEIVRSPAEVELFVQTSRPTTDRYFSYSLRYVERPTTDLWAFMDLVIEERPDARGETLDELGFTSTYFAMLQDLTPLSTWLSFALDVESIDAFRVAREMAIDRGFATHFDLLSIDFPMTLPLSDDAVFDPLAEVVPLPKPLR